MSSIERQQSEFNMAVSYLNRINTHLFLADEASLQLDPYNWSNALRTLFRSISSEMQDKEIEEFKSSFKKINEIIQNDNNSKKNYSQREIGSELYEMIEDVQIKLNKVLKESGLLLKMKQSAEFALEDN